ncbi:hypothetical protein MYP_3012 [Sporocytophaga myxococcoides]|uniref:Uncharacterized protein n=1 Tax=Sporocytophaga myxococcoides TaxID=153721 RepID=A0A098LIC1_9BACT|nr:hypothetical protein [Sporocytophaga myxococcoides]GAL85783.1 hypothetical protein MYP_3012 [Sporocytophaga myxococcoides]
MKKIVKVLLTTFAVILISFSILALFSEQNYLYVVLIGGLSYFVPFAILNYIYVSIIFYGILQKSYFAKLFVQLMIITSISTILVIIAVISEMYYHYSKFDIDILIENKRNVFQYFIFGIVVAVVTGIIDYLIFFKSLTMPAKKGL